MTTLTKNFSNFLVGVLVASILLGAASPARAAGAPRLKSVLHSLTRKSHYSRFTVRGVPAAEADKRIAAAAKEKARSAGSHVMETFLFIFTIAVIDVTAREIKKEGLKTLSPERLAAIAAKSAHAIVDMPEIYTGLAGATATMTVARIPLATLESILKSPKVKTAFVPVLTRAATSTLGLMGWEFGSQLWTEAAVGLSDEDYEIAKSFLGIGSGVAKTLAMAGDSRDLERARVAKLMVKNMVRVMFLNSDLRTTWMKNTWRLHVLTGDFAALLAAMVAAGEVGAKYGKWRGFFAGVVFGAATLAIPRGPKDAVTGFFQGLRGNVDQAKLAENSQTLATLTSNPTRYRLILQNRRLHREAIATLGWEKIHRAIATKDAPAFVRELDGLSALYTNELRAIAALKAKAPASVHAALDGERANVATLSEFASLLKEGGPAMAGDSEFKQIADANNARGFDEAAVIASMRSE